MWRIYRYWRQARRRVDAAIDLESVDPVGQLGAVQSAVAVAVELAEFGPQVAVGARLAAIDLPAGEQIKLAPGGLHLMMMDLKQPITAGQTLGFTLTLEDANGKRRERQIEAQVRSGAGAGQGDGHGAHQHH